MYSKQDVVNLLDDLIGSMIAGRNVEYFGDEFKYQRQGFDFALSYVTFTMGLLVSDIQYMERFLNE